MPHRVLQQGVDGEPEAFAVRLDGDFVQGAELPAAFGCWSPPLAGRQNIANRPRMRPSNSLAS